MALFPRTKAPNESEYPSGPMAVLDWGNSGVGQFADFQRIGNRWEEGWPPLRASDPGVQALLTFIRRMAARGTVVTLRHYNLPGSGMEPNGVGGGTPLVNGADQTGATLNTDGWPASTTNVVRAGDIIRIAGVSHIIQVAEDADSDGSGEAAITIEPPFLAGSSPADNAALSLTDNLITCRISGYQMPRSRRSGTFIGGLRVSFQESP